MRSGALVIVFLVGCIGAEIDGRGLPLGGGDSPDAAPSTPTPDSPGGPTTGPDGGMTTVVPTAACMAKGYVAVPGLTSLYRLSQNEAKWLDAATACNADVAGATHLVVLSSTVEATFVRDRQQWIGLSDLTTEGTFKNVTMEPNDVRPFSNGQPDNGSNSEDCAQMKDDGLDDDQCDNGHQYICECDGRAIVP